MRLEKPLSACSLHGFAMMLIMIPTIDTERLRLRGFEESDFEAWAALCADTEVTHFLGGTKTRAEAWRHMALYLGHWQLRGYGMWVIEERSSGRFLGRVGLLNPEGWPGLEIGWALTSEAQGHGFATEAAQAVIAWTSSELGAERLIALIVEPNFASARLAERLGFQIDGEVELGGLTPKVWAKALEPSAERLQGCDWQLNQVTVRVADIERSAAFYRRLGLRHIVDSPHYGRFECPVGGATFSIHIGEVSAEPSTVVYFESADLDAQVATLEARGITVESQPEDQRWAWREARLRDPDDNPICLYQAGDNRRWPAWRVKHS